MAIARELIYNLEFSHQQVSRWWCWREIALGSTLDAREGITFGSTWDALGLWGLTAIANGFCQSKKFLFIISAASATKSIGTMPHLKLSKKCFWDKFFEKQTKIVTHMDLWKYDQILTIQKSLTIKQLRFSKKRLFIWIYHLLLHYILSPNNKCGMWINIKFSILWCSTQMTNPCFSISKVHYY